MAAVEAVNAPTAPESQAARRWFGARWSRPVLTLALPALAIMLLAWQSLQLEPAPGLDPSWTAVGFLEYPTLWYGGLATAAFLYTGLVRFGLALAFFASTRRTFGAPAAFVIAVVVAAIANQASEPVIALIAMVAAMSADVGPRTKLAVSAAAGACAGIELLAKISIGLTLTVMTAIFIFSLPGRRRDYVAAAAAFVLALLTCWLLTGQALSDLPSYASNSDQIVTGYASAMGAAVGGLGWQGPAAAFTLAAGVWGGMHMTELEMGRSRWGMVALWVVFWFFMFKEGFVRHDSGHATVFFSAVVGGFLAFRWRPAYRTSALVCVAALLIFVLAAEGGSFGQAVDPIGSVRAAARDAGDILSPSHRAQIQAAGRAQIMAADPLDSNALSLLDDRTVAVYPYELAIAWAYRLNWDPLPVLQSYSAYTSALDRLDTDFLESRLAPQRIVFAAQPSVDGRLPMFDEGRAERTILCRYQLLWSKGSFAVLGLAPNRCGMPVPLRTTRAAWGQPVPVPPLPNAHSLVFVRIGGVGVNGIEQITGALFRPAIRYVVVNGSVHRLVPGTAEDGLPLEASPGSDFPAPFSLTAGARTISVLRSGQVTPEGGESVTYSFYAQPIESPR